MKKKKEIFVLILLITAFFVLNYSWIDKKLENFLLDYEIVFIKRVIDGDTVETNESKIRLLGINSPEKNEDYSDEAKEFLEEFVLNKEVRLDFGNERYDRYNRTLAYITFDRENINLKLVEEGLANFYFPSGKDNNYKKFLNAWEECIKENKNLCEKSEDECVNCIKLKEFNNKNQEIIFHNICGFDCDLSEWKIKDEGRKNFIFPEFILKSEEEIKIIVGDEENNDKELFWQGEKYVWTNSGDTLFLRDKLGKLVLWKNY